MTSFLERMAGEYEARHRASRALNQFLKDVLAIRGVDCDPDFPLSNWKIVSLPLVEGWDIEVFDRHIEQFAHFVPGGDHFNVFDPVIVALSPTTNNDTLDYDAESFNEPAGVIIVGSNVVFLDGAPLDAESIEQLHRELRDLCG